MAASARGPDGQVAGPCSPPRASRRPSALAARTPRGCPGPGQHLAVFSTFEKETVHWDVCWASMLWLRAGRGAQRSPSVKYEQVLSARHMGGGVAGGFAPEQTHACAHVQRRVSQKPDVRASPSPPVCRVA